MPKYVIGPVKETPPGSKKDVRVGGLSIAVFNVDGAFYALNNRCPHQGAPLFKGTLCGRIDATGPGEYEYDPQKTLAIIGREDQLPQLQRVAGDTYTRVGDLYPLRPGVNLVLYARRDLVTK